MLVCFVCLVKDSSLLSSRVHRLQRRMWWLHDRSGTCSSERKHSAECFSLNSCTCGVADTSGSNAPLTPASVNSTPHPFGSPSSLVGDSMNIATGDDPAAAAPVRMTSRQVIQLDALARLVACRKRPKQQDLALDINAVARQTSQDNGSSGICNSALYRGASG